MMHSFTHSILVIGVLLLCAAPAAGQAGNFFIQGLAPDWDQPLDYPDPFGFDPTGPFPGDLYWNAWCAPTAAACLIGHFEDANGRVALSDCSPDGNPFKIPPGYQGSPWARGARWHDYTADGWDKGPGPNPLRGTRRIDDIGVYMDTGGHISGMFHGGTYYRDMAPGLNGFFAAKGNRFGQPAMKMVAVTWGLHPAFGGYAPHQLFNALKAEIDNNRTAVAHFRHWNLIPNGPPANPGTGDERDEEEFELEEYYFGSWTPGGGHEEEWNGDEGEEGLGHAVLVVGYTQDIAGVVTHFIVHDNWPSTGRNVQVPVSPELAAITFVDVARNFFVPGLAPDWEQPLDYPDPFDPLNGPVAGDPFWNAWCAPTAAACLIGHWADVRRRIPLGDGSPDGNQFLIPPGYMGPPWGAGPAWHDYTADGNIPGGMGPNPLRGFRAVEDLGYYMDTNGSGILGAPHPGTFYKDAAPGLNRFFTAKGKGAGQPAFLMKAFTRGVHPAFKAWPMPKLIQRIRYEVDSGRTAIAHFMHWNIVPAGPPAAPGTGYEVKEDEFDVEEYDFENYTSSGCHGEYWNAEEGEEGLGHAVLVVGYTQDIAENLTHLIVHDNWPVTGRNVKVPAGPNLAAVTFTEALLYMVPWVK
jgi:hypothetical protein